MTVALQAFEIADLFCGGGWASEGVRLALGRDPTVAVNHSPEAIAVHTANHPGTRELFRAQGFRDAYRIDVEIDGAPLTKTAQVRLAGNSVPPQLVEAIVRANLRPARGEERAA